MELEPNISIAAAAEFVNMMAEEGTISVLSVLSVTAMITTISLFFCGIPICIEIWRRKSTHEISGFPFIMGFLGGTFWLRYGMLKTDFTMITVNCVGVSLMFVYMLFYLHFTKPKTFYLIQMAAVWIIISTMLIFVEIYLFKSLDLLGFVSMTFNIVNFGAPLAGLRVVLRKRSSETLPLPLCVANLLVSSQWCLYGVLVHDIYIIIPNGAGSSLALIQVALFLLFPRKQGGKAPLNYCCPCFCESGLSHKLENNYQRVTTLPPSRASNRISSRNCRAIDRSSLPSSRVACINFLRSDEFTSGRYRGVVNNSTSSRTTGLTTESKVSNKNTGEKALNRLSSISYPELLDVNDDQSGAVEPGLPFDVSMTSTAPLVSSFRQVADSGFFCEVEELKQSSQGQMIRTSSAPDLVAE